VSAPGPMMGSCQEDDAKRRAASSSSSPLAPHSPSALTSVTAVATSKPSPKHAATQLEKAVADLREAFAVVEVSSPNFVATFLEKVVRRCAIEEDEAKVDRGVKKLLSR